MAMARLRIISESTGNRNFIAWSDYLQGLVLLQRGNFDEAIPFLKQAVRLKYFHLARPAADAMGTLATAYQANGQLDLAAEVLREFSDFAAYYGEPLESLVKAQSAGIALMDGRNEPAIKWLRETIPPSALGMMGWFIQPRLIRCRVMIAAGSTASLGEAENELREIADMNRANHNVYQLIRTHSLLSLACSVQDKMDEAFCSLGEALNLAESGGLVFSFLELGRPMSELLAMAPVDETRAPFVEKIQSATPVVKPAVVPVAGRHDACSTMIEPLTSREQEILELLAQRLRDKEIAARLFISPQTVNSHTKALFQKLSVRNRRAAVAEGLKLQLLVEG